MFDPDKKCKILGIGYNVGDLREASQYVLGERQKLSGSYICFTNVHGTIMAQDDKAYMDAVNGAAFVFPDGHPIAAEEKKRGFAGAKRIAGPDFMKEVFMHSAEGKVSHFFYGSSQETLKKLEESLKGTYPGIDIKGMYSPPFRKLSKEEIAGDIELINRSGADLVWIGLGAPKQELFMHMTKGRIKGLMLGVGAGFDFHAGTVKRAPLWMQRTGLEWLYRLFQDPKRLFKRYFVTNTRFLWYTRVLKK